MADEPTTSPSTSATGEPGQPATGTTSGSATPPKSTPTLEDVLRENDELKRSHTNAKEELERHRKKLSAYEKQEQERAALEQAAKDAQLSEIERVKKQHQDAEARIKQQQQQLVLSHIRELAKEKGIINPKLIAPVVERELEYDKDGEPTNIEKILDDLIKNNPYLVPQQAEPATPPAQTAQTPQVPALPTMNAPAGRGSLSAGTNPTGKPTRLSDIQWSR